MSAPSRASAGLALAACFLGACHRPVRTAPEPTREAAEAAARRAVQGERAISLDTFPSQAVGVGPFAATAGDTIAEPLSYGLADLLLTDLARSGQLQLVDRLRTQALLREVDLARTGAVDPATAPRVGRLIGARRLVIGALSGQPDGSIRIDARVADVATGNSATAVDASAPLDRILDAEKQVAFRLFDALGVTLTPSERAAVEQRPTRNVSALIAYSRAVRAEALGNTSEAAAEYARAAQIDPGFTMAARRAQALGATGPSASTRSLLRHAGVLAASGINESLAEGLRDRSRADDPAFTHAQQALVVIVVRVVP